jgi:succinate-semialdehyde dehydrogenase/glutarate-semialdehyde dehydrogenase
VSLSVKNPRTGQLDFAIEPAGPAALDALARKLRKAQPSWAKRTAQERADILLRWATAIDDRETAITRALTEDTGRRTLSQLEVAAVAQLIRRCAARAPGLLAQHSPIGRATSIPTITTSTLLVPYELVGVISPWNFPLTLSLIDAIPALAAGCAVLVKPSEVTSRFVEPLVAATRKVPEVAEVLALVPGDAETGAALIDRVDFLCFTGSVATGRTRIHSSEPRAGRQRSADCSRQRGPDPSRRDCIARQHPQHGPGLSVH